MTSISRSAKLSLCTLALIAVTASAHGGYHHVWTIFPERSGVRVLTSVPQLAQVAKKIGGKRVSIVSLLKSKTDFRSPKIYRSMIKATKEADVLLRLNTSLDPWIEDLVEQSSNQRLHTEKGTGDACVKADLSQQDSDLDSVLNEKETAQSIAGVVLAALVRADPKNESYYQSNSHAYLHQLTASDQPQHSNKQ